jgi:hypothetical protein
MAGGVLKEIGYIYFCSNDYKGASMAYESAIKTYEELGSSRGQDFIMECKVNLDTIKAKEKDPEVEISMLRGGF